MFARTALTIAFITLSVLELLPAVAEAEASKDLVWHESIGSLGFTLRPAEDGSRGCTITLSGISDEIRYFSLNDPERIVIDALAPKRFGSNRALRPKDGIECIKGIRIGVHPEFSRIVIDVGPSPHRLLHRDDSLVVTILAPTEAREQSLRSVVAPSATPAPQLVTARARPPIMLVQLVSATRVRNQTAIPKVASVLPPELLMPTEVSSRSERELIPELAGEKVQELRAGRFQVDRIFLSLSNKEAGTGESRTAKYPSETVTVTNISEQPLQLTARAFSVLNPGSEDEQETPTKNLLVSPSIFAIPAGQSRRVRIVGMLPSDNNVELAFRVYLALTSLLPAPEQQAQLNPPSKVSASGASGIAINIAQRPRARGGSLQVRHLEDELVSVKNEANYSIKLSDVRVCQKRTNLCQELSTTRLYPGNSLHLKLPDDAVFNASTESDGDYAALSIIGGLR